MSCCLELIPILHPLHDANTPPYLLLQTSPVPRYLEDTVFLVLVALSSPDLSSPVLPLDKNPTLFAYVLVLVASVFLPVQTEKTYFLIIQPMPYYLQVHRRHRQKR